MFPATLFDYNGVLADDEDVHLEAFRDVLQPLGIELSRDDYWERYLGFDDVGAFANILADHALAHDAERVRTLVEEKKPKYLARARAGLRTFPEAARVLRERCQAGPVVIVSGALRAEIELGLEVLGTRDCVMGIVAAEDTHRSKPDPEGYQLGKQMLASRLSPGAADRALVIEDSISGIEAAKRAGLPCLAVGHSYGKAELEAAGADRVIDSIAGVSDQLLEELFRQLYG